MRTEHLSSAPLPASIGPRPDAEHYQRHPIPGQQRLFAPYGEPFSRPQPEDDPQWLRLMIDRHGLGPEGSR